MKLFKKLGIFVASFAMGIGAISTNIANKFMSANATELTASISFKSSTNGDSTSAINKSDSLDSIIATGGNYIKSINSTSKVYLGKNGYGLKLGSSSAAGNIEFNLDSSYLVKSVIVEAAKYSTDTGKIAVNETTINTDLSSSFTMLTLNYDSPLNFSTLKIATTSKRAYVKSISFVYSSDVETYSLIFDTNGGSEIASQSVAEGNNATKPTIDPTKAGYSFGGWYADEELTTPFDFANTPINEDTTIYAKWLTNHTVSFETNGGSEVSSQTIADGKNVIRPTDPTKDGFAFAGWYADEELTTPFDFANTAINEDIVVFAKWSTYVVVAFETNGGSAIPSQSIAEGGKATKPTNDPTKSGYSFAGWYADEELTTPFDFANTAINANTTIYAKWDAYSDDLGLNGTIQFLYFDINYLKLTGNKTSTPVATGVAYNENPTALQFDLVGDNKYTIGCYVEDNYEWLYCIDNNNGLRFGTNNTGNDWSVAENENGEFVLQTIDPSNNIRQLSYYSAGNDFRTYKLSSTALTTIGITQKPVADTTFVEIDELSFSELVIGATEIITAQFEGKSIEWSSKDSTIVAATKNQDNSCSVTGLKEGKTTITATVGNKQSSIDITVIKAPLPGDNISLSAIDITYSGYTYWTKTIGKNTYSGTSLSNGNNIQLTGDSEKTSGIVSTGMNFKALSIAIDWGDSTSNGRTINVYGSNSKYSSPADLYDLQKCGTLIGTIVKGTSTSLDLSALDFAYIGVRVATSNAVYCSRIAIEWEDTNYGRDDSLFTSNYTELLVSDSFGIRFEGYVNEEYVDAVIEYGFVITRKDGKKATLNSVKENVSKLLSEINDERDGLMFDDGEAIASKDGFLCFSSILKNIPENESISFYAYVVLDIDGDGKVETFASPVSESIEF